MTTYSTKEILDNIRRAHNKGISVNKLATMLFENITPTQTILLSRAIKYTVKGVKNKV